MLFSHTSAVTRRLIFPWVILAIHIAACTFSVAHAASQSVWIGTGNAWPSQGIYHAQLDLETGKLTRPELAAEVSGPGFLAMHPKGSHLYAAASLNGSPSVIAYRILEGNQGELQQVNALPIGDGGATHLAVSADGSLLVTAQYGGGSVAVFDLKENGQLGSRKQLIEHRGGSQVVPGRQDAPHPHWVGFSPDQRHVLVPDLGMDAVMTYGLDINGGRLGPKHRNPMVAGGGPRHMKFHPNGQWAYVLNELSLSLTLCDYVPEDGRLLPRQTVNTVPQESLLEERFASASEVRVHPSGRFVYAANRGHDTITAFAIDGESGRLSVIEREFVRGATPRNFNIDPTGRWLLAAGQHSHTLASFEIDSITGALHYSGHVAMAPSAICVLFGHE